MSINIKPITIVNGEVINEDVFGDIGNNFTKVKTAVDGVVDDVNNLLSGGTIKNELEIVLAKADKNITDLNSQFSKVDTTKKELDTLSASAKESKVILEPLTQNATTIASQLTDVNAEANLLNTDLVAKNETAQTIKSELRSEINNADEKLKAFKNYDTTELVPKANKMLNDMYCDRELISINHKLNGYPTVKLTYVKYGAGIGGAGDYPAGGDSENLIQNKTIYKDENNLTVYVPSNYYFGTPSIEKISNYQYMIVFSNSGKSILIDLIDRNIEEDIEELYSSVDVKSDNIDNSRATEDKSVTGAINELHSGLGKVTTQVSKLPNSNLLINSDFQVWQRGTSFSSDNTNPMYTADRWRMSSDASMKVTKQDYGVSIETTSVGLWHNFEQYIELPQHLKGKKVTLSIKLHSKGVIQQLYAGVKNSTLSGDKSLEGVFNSTKTDLFTYTFTIPTGDYAFLYIGVQTEEKVGAKLEVEYIKLELGEIATPFIHLLYCEELALCQRYYEIVRFHGRVAKGMNELVSSIPFKVTKRIIPTNKNLVSSVYDTSVGWISKVANVSDFNSVECCYFNIGSTNVIMDVHVTASSDSDIY